MDLLTYYPHLAGSHGKLRLQLKQGLLNHLCTVLKKQASEHVTDIRIRPSGENRFRIQAELSNAFFHWIGSLGLRVLRDDGIEIQIEQSSASPASPVLHGWMDTTVIGKSVAIPRLVQLINDGLGAGEAIKVRDSEWRGWTQFRVFVTLDPFPLLRKYLPSGMGEHLTQVQWQTNHEAFFLELSWQHSGV